MLLLIDAGNTRIKWAVLDPAKAPKPGDWLQMGSLYHHEFDAANPPWRQFAIKRVVASNVAGDVIRDRLAHSFHGAEVVWFVSEAHRAGIENQYRNPNQLGSDRFAAAIAAHALFPNQPLIIATCGTGLTIDAVTADGKFIGGMIAPGLKLMAQSLSQNAAQLSLNVVEEMSTKAHFANHTEAGIASGCIAAQVGAIEYGVRELGLSQQHEPLCIISGGAAKYIMPSLKIPHQFVDNLVLIGLQLSCN